MTVKHYRYWDTPHSPIPSLSRCTVSRPVETIIFSSSHVRILTTGSQVTRVRTDRGLRWERTVSLPCTSPPLENLTSLFPNFVKFYSGDPFSMSLT